jgi:hypothetical protein
MILKIQNKKSGRTRAASTVMLAGKTAMFSCALFLLFFSVRRDLEPIVYAPPAVITAAASAVRRIVRSLTQQSTAVFPVNLVSAQL